MHRPLPRGRRLAVSAAGALAVLAATAPSALSADQATLRMLGSSPIYADTVAVHKAGGGDVNVQPARYHYRITTPSGVTEASGNCVDLSHYIVTGRDYTVELQDAADDPDPRLARVQGGGVAAVAVGPADRRPPPTRASRPARCRWRSGSSPARPGGSTRPPATSR